jgi:hypothetical protein
MFHARTDTHTIAYPYIAVLIKTLRRISQFIFMPKPNRSHLSHLSLAFLERTKALYRLLNNDDRFNDVEYQTENVAKLQSRS